jgi:putative transposase
VINPLVEELASHTNVKTACDLLGRPRGSHYRAKAPKPARQPGPRPAPPNALSDDERAQVLGVLTSDRFVDKSVAQAWATLLDEGTYLCSMATMHRILRAHGAAGERRAQATHPARTKPELVATKPGQVWSWDITKLRGPERGVYYDLYVVLDIFSRFVVAWTIAACEDSQIAKTMLEQAMGVHGIPEAIHADRGTSMTSKPVAQLMVDLGVARSHSRPHVSNDNPYSEAAFKTLKYAPVFPERQGVEDLAGDGAFEGAEDLLRGPALGQAGVAVGAGSLVVGHADFDDVVQGGVGLPVPAAGEAMFVGAAGGDRDRRRSAQGGERGGGA